MHVDYSILTAAATHCRGVWWAGRVNALVQPVAPPTHSLHWATFAVAAGLTPSHTRFQPKGPQGRGARGSRCCSKPHMTCDSSRCSIAWSTSHCLHAVYLHSCSIPSPYAGAKPSDYPPARRLTSCATESEVYIISLWGCLTACVVQHAPAYCQCMHMASLKSALNVCMWLLRQMWLQHATSASDSY